MLSSSHPKHHIKPPMKVLLVEDSALLRDVITENLKDCKQIDISQFAATQSNATVLLDSQQFDMLLVDIELAEGNGFEVIKHIQSIPFKAPILVMLTNNAHPHYRLYAKELGVQYYFDKSMNFELAMETILREAAKFSAANI